MAYAKIANNEVVKYPYSIEMLKEEFPNTSLPSGLDVIKKAPDGSFQIVDIALTKVPTFDALTHKVQETDPELVDGVWTQAWIVVELTEAELARNANFFGERVRKERDEALKISDIYVLRAYENGETVDAAVVAYRQALRDITTQEGFPHNVEFPIDPLNSAAAPAPSV